ncbi:MAG TPA: dihydrodipicolinate synthase family protein [Solirubrobacteraceae bacterium]|nr:dihydrodipicolinate synthase family protein [Solirubrobacteraceae bacterium]
MAREQRIHGIIAYPITPFSETGVDVERLSDLVGTMVDAGVHGIAPLGSTGESAYLSFDEWKTVVDTTVAAVAGRVPVVVGSSDLSTAGTVARAEYAEQAGASAVMVIPVSYWALNEREIVQHYTSVSDAISIPIMAYNNPATAGIDMSPKLLTHMFDSIANVEMVKESTGDLQRMLDLKDLSGGLLPFYNGSNPLVLEALLAGASGWCTAAPCLRPGPVIALYEAVLAGDTDRAEELYEELLPLLSFIVSKGLPTAVKSGLDILGEPAGAPRLPLLPLDSDDRSRLQSILSHV